MTPAEKVQDWCHFYRVSPSKYQMNALLAVLKNDGEKILVDVLKSLKLERSVDLVKDAAKKE